MAGLHANNAPTLLVADDEAEIADIVKAVGEGLGFAVTCVLEGLEVMVLVDRIKPDVIVLDLRMPGADGVEIIRELGNRKCQAKIVLMSGMDQRTLSSVQALGRKHDLDIGSTLTKPMSIDAIEDALRPYASGGKPAPGLAQADPVTRFNYGLIVYYEPELVLLPVANVNDLRIRVVPQWRLDDGQFIAERELRDWASQNHVFKGIVKMLLASSLETLRVWGNQDFTPQLILRLNSELFFNLDTPDVLAEMVDSYSVPRELITIEVEETAVTREKDSIVDVMSRLRIKGFKISICIQSDGEEILPILDSLPVDGIVINMDYLSRKPGFLHDMESEFLYSSMTSMINHKGIGVCASNVNSADVREFLDRCEFNSVRGTQIQEPITADCVLPLYREQKFAEKSLSDWATPEESR